MSDERVARRPVESVLISLGSNIDPEVNIVRSVDVLRESVEVVAASRVYATDPVAEDPVPEFLNAALEIRTDLAPLELKYGVLRKVEERLGRQRTADRNAPREIDMDMALYGSRIIDDPEHGLLIPDPDIVRYAHVLLPLADIAPDRLHPVAGRTLRDLAREFEGAAAVRLASDGDSLRDRLHAVDRRADKLAAGRATGD